MQLNQNLKVFYPSIVPVRVNCFSRLTYRSCQKSIGNVHKSCVFPTHNSSIRSMYDGGQKSSRSTDCLISMATGAMSCIGSGEDSCTSTLLLPATFTDRVILERGQGVRVSSSLFVDECSTVQLQSSIQLFNTTSTVRLFNYST